MDVSRQIYGVAKRPEAMSELLAKVGFETVFIVEARNGDFSSAREMEALLRAVRAVQIASTAERAVIVVFVAKEVTHLGEQFIKAGISVASNYVPMLRVRSMVSFMFGQSTINLSPPSLKSAWIPSPRDKADESLPRADRPTSP